MAASHFDDCSVMEKSSSSFSRLPPPLSRSEFWNRAEDVTREIIELVHPTLVSEARRNYVIDYMQRLIKLTLGYEVHAFGSVPLKTYLPDGDIDLTAFGEPCNDDELAHQIFSLLETEKQNVNAQIIIKDVKLRHAEVKLVTCLVQNLAVDISFNKLCGISTLCFLEKIDQLIGKDHLLKRSIILIKAWCYYESHILGAVHGLISTYALETLVLYIFQLFHSSLDGPLAVLYKFLDYFSKFDWDNYCISLSGPVCRSYLPEIVVETPENGGQDLLLTSEFLMDCLDIYCLPSRGSETNARAFQSKYLNIVDPLEENNNLGRSVNKANFNRIRTAFTFGARKLERIFFQSSEEEDISFELRKFFSNLLRKHRSGQRPDVLDVIPSVRYNSISSASAANHVQEGQMVYESESSSSYGATAGNDVLDKENVSPLNGKHHSSLHRIENGEPLNGSVKEEMNATGTPNFLTDLTGDNVSQLCSLVDGRWWLGYVQNGPTSPISTQHNSWEVFPHALPFLIPDAPLGLVNADGAHVFLVNPQMIPNANFSLEELPKPQGTGTYFPNMNQYRDRPFFRRRGSRRNYRPSMAQLPSEMNSLERNTRERHHHNPNETNDCCDTSQAGILGSFSDTNGSIDHPHEPLPAEVSYPPEGSKQSDVATSIPSSMQEDRVTCRQSYNLTDDQEFPPL